MSDSYENSQYIIKHVFKAVFLEISITYYEHYNVIDELTEIALKL